MNLDGRKTVITPAAHTAGAYQYFESRPVAAASSAVAWALQGNAGVRACQRLTWGGGAGANASTSRVRLNPDFTLPAGAFVQHV